METTHDHARKVVVDREAKNDKPDVNHTDAWFSLRAIGAATAITVIIAVAFALAAGRQFQMHAGCGGGFHLDWTTKKSAN